MHRAVMLEFDDENYRLAAPAGYSSAFQSPGPQFSQTHASLEKTPLDGLVLQFYISLMYLDIRD
jgi:hypothetical protein